MTPETTDRADVDDRAGAATEHLAADAPRDLERPGEHHTDLKFPLRVWNLDGLGEDEQPGVVHEHVDRAEPLRRARYSVLNLLGVANVETQADGTSAARLQLLGLRQSSLLVEVADYHRGAQLRHPGGDRRPYALGRARHQCGASGELEGIKGLGPAAFNAH